MLCYSNGTDNNKKTTNLLPKPLRKLQHLVIQIVTKKGKIQQQQAIKNVALYFCPYLRQLMTDFQNSFTDTLCEQFASMWLLYIPQCRKFISTLPCKIWMKYACITITTNKHFGKIEKKHFRPILQWMVCITLDSVGPTQSSVIRIIHRNVGLKHFSFT